MVFFEGLMHVIVDFAIRTYIYFSFIDISAGKSQFPSDLVSSESLRLQSEHSLCELSKGKRAGISL